MNQNIDKEQALILIRTWGAGFWQKIPARHVKAVLGLYSLTDAAVELGVSVPTLWGHVEAGRLPGASVVFASRAYYTAAEVRKLRVFFADKERRGKRQRADAAEMRRKWLGGVSQVVIAAQHGVSQGTVSRVVRGKR